MKILFILLFSCCIMAFEIPKLKTKFFELILDRVEVLYEDPKIIGSYLRVKKINKTRLLVGYFDIREPIGNDFIAEYKALKKQGGEYRYLPYSVPPSPVCDFMSEDKYFYKDLARNSDLPEDIANNCPLAVGNYSINGYTVNTDKMIQVAVQSGEYAIEVYVHKKGQNVMYLRIYVYINNV